MEGVENPHRRGRAGAAAAAAASEMLPINGKRPLKRVRQPSEKTPREAPPGRAPPRTTSATAAARAGRSPPALPPLTGDDLPIPTDIAGDVAGVLNGDASASSCADGGGGRISKPPMVPPPPLPRNAQGKLPLLQERAGIDADEAYGEQELALSSYLKLHPVLSLEATSHQTLQLVADLIDETWPSRPRSSRSSPRAGTTRTWRPPNLAVNERACNLGNRCICVWMARWRYGDDTDLAFVGAEFLLPSQREVFDRKRASCPRRRASASCARATCTPTSTAARAATRPSAPTRRSRCRPLGTRSASRRARTCRGTRASCNDSDGYRQEALLFVDEAWADTAAARGGRWPRCCGAPSSSSSRRTTPTCATTTRCRA